MTAAHTRIIPAAPPARSTLPTLEARWCGLARQRAGQPADAPARIERVALVIILQLDRGPHGSLEAFIERDGARETLRPRQEIACETCVRDGLLHVELADPADRTVGRMLTMTISAPGLSDGNAWEQAAAAVERESRLLYIRTPLVQDAGLTGGRSDPPVLRILPAEV